MLNVYSTNDLLPVASRPTQYYIGTFEDTEDREAEWPHRHSFYSMVWFTQGDGSYVIDFIEYEIKPQRIFFVNPGQVHNWDYSENCTGYIIVVDGLLASEISLHFKYPFADIRQEDNILYTSILTNLITNYQADIFPCHIRYGIQYLSSLLLQQTAMQTIAPYPTDPILEKFNSLILEENTGLTPVESYAKRMHVAVDELNRICKTYFEKSAKQYLLDLKITEAKRLLLFSTLNINEITFRLGFEDASYFARIFKKKAGLSPSDFLKKYRK